MSHKCRYCQKEVDLRKAVTGIVGRRTKTPARKLRTTTVFYCDRVCKKKQENKIKLK